jgi:hypothetical protein
LSTRGSNRGVSWKEFGPKSEQNGLPSADIVDHGV